MLWVRLGLWVSDEPLGVLGAGQHGLGAQELTRCTLVDAAGRVRGGRRRGLRGDGGRERSVRLGGCMLPTCYPLTV